MRNFITTLPFAETYHHNQPCQPFETFHHSVGAAPSLPKSIIAPNLINRLKLTIVRLKPINNNTLYLHTITYQHNRLK